MLIPDPDKHYPSVRWNGVWRWDRPRLRLVIEWRDLWVGVFIDRQKHRIYILPIPCFGIVLEF